MKLLISANNEMRDKSPITSEGPLVTIAIPIYKRLDCLHLALQSIAAQDYPLIELIVSDNGQNGEKVRSIVEQWYRKPFVYRANAVTVNLPQHHAQMLAQASGSIFLYLPDDDTVSPNYVSEVVRALTQRPDVSVVIGKQEEVDASGNLIRSSPDELPEYIPGDEFIGNWIGNGFASYTAIVARTEDIRRLGGFLDCPWGNHSDNALMLKLCLSGAVAYAKNCAYRLRYDTGSFGWSLSINRFAQDTKCFLRFLRSDPWLLEYSQQRPERWVELRRVVERMTWQTYLDRWLIAGRNHPPMLKWVRAAFVLPPFPGYYRRVARATYSAVRQKLRARGH